MKTKGEGGIRYCSQIPSLAGRVGSGRGLPSTVLKKEELIAVITKFFPKVSMENFRKQLQKCLFFNKKKIIALGHIRIRSVYKAPWDWVGCKEKLGICPARSLKEIKIYSINKVYIDGPCGSKILAMVSFNR